MLSNSHQVGSALALAAWLLVPLLCPPALASEEELSPEVHRELFVRDAYPSAEVCGTCHQRQYREWSVSPHS